MREENFKGNSAAGPSIVHFQMKCFDLKGGLTETSPSEKLVFPITDEPASGPKMEATKSESPEESTSEMDDEEGKEVVTTVAAGLLDPLVLDSLEARCCLNLLAKSRVRGL